MSVLSGKASPMHGTCCTAPCSLNCKQRSTMRPTTLLVSPKYTDCVAVACWEYSQVVCFPFIAPALSSLPRYDLVSSSFGGGTHRERRILWGSPSNWHSQHWAGFWRIHPLLLASLTALAPLLSLVLTQSLSSLLFLIIRKGLSVCLHFWKFWGLGQSLVLAP